jgi:hypothetical protein
VETVTDEYHSGSRCLRQNLPMYSGTIRTLTALWPTEAGYPNHMDETFNEVYERYYVKWSSGWRWHVGDPNDYKVVFTHMRGHGHTYQDVRTYGDETHAMILFSWGGNTGPYSTSSLVTVGVWYLFEWHLVYNGANSYAEAKLNGVPVEFGTDGRSGGTYDPYKIYPGTDYPTYCGPFSAISTDGYCNYSGYSGYMYFDDFKVTDGGGWIGGTEGPQRTLFRP